MLSMNYLHLKLLSQLPLFLILGKYLCLALREEKSSFSEYISLEVSIKSVSVNASFDPNKL